jgi:hypothetical protein
VDILGDDLVGQYCEVGTWCNAFEQPPPQSCNGDRINIGTENLIANDGKPKRGRYSVPLARPNYLSAAPAQLVEDLQQERPVAAGRIEYAARSWFPLCIFGIRRPVPPIEAGANHRAGNRLRRVHTSQLATRFWQIDYPNGAVDWAPILNNRRRHSYAASATQVVGTGIATQIVGT